ncbi:MAG: KH domain-containing protein [Sphaerobacteraceae bacterium]|nr:MAG: KH domain-containing protein [Sphaerobacteraceae bacterium]
MEELERLVEYMACNLVDDPEAVKVESSNRGQMVIIHLSVPEDEMGKVIGRQGRIARSMRTLLNTAASRRGMRASLDIDD